MNTQPAHAHSTFRPARRATLGARGLFAGALALLAGVFCAQHSAEAQTAAPASQPYVGRYDIYAGYTDLNSPHIGLNEDGYHVQVGINPRRWYALGVDYSSSNGSLLLTPNLLPDALQAQVNAGLTQLKAAGVIPPTYVLVVPTDSFTQTFAVGPQLMFRHYPRAAFFLRPSVGAIRERATPKPTNAVAQLFTAQLAPAGYKIDWTGFYGVGFGADIAITKHFGLRPQVDYVYDHLFNDLLRDGRETFRLSIGPSFHFGKNVSR